MGKRKNQVIVREGCGVFGLLAVALTVVLFVMKLTGAISCSWLWVFSPILIYVFGGLALIIAIGVLILLVLGIIAFFAWLFDA